MTRNRIAAILLAGASLGAIAPAQAAKILFSTAVDSSGQPLAPGSAIGAEGIKTSGGTIQVMLDSGAIVSFVGPASFAVGSDGGMTVASGSTTIVSFGVATPVTLPGGQSASVTGAGSFNIGPNGVNGMALAGAIALTSAGETRSFGPGQSYTAILGQNPSLVFAAAPQAVPGLDNNPAAGSGGVSGTDAGAPSQNPAIPGLTPGTPAQVAQALRTALSNGGGAVDGGFASALLALAGPNGTGSTGSTGGTSGTGSSGGGSGSTGTGSTGTGSTGTGSTGTTTGTGSTGTGSTGTTTGTVSGGTGTTGGTTTETGGTGSTGTGGSGSTGTGGTGSTGTSGTTSPSRPVAIFGRNENGQNVGGDPGVVAVGFDAGGNPNDFGLYGTPNTVTLSERHVDTAAGWIIGRYTNGIFVSGGINRTFGPNQGVSFAVVAPLTGSLPTGLATYGVTSFTQPLLTSGAYAITDATFAATLGVAFGTAPRIGYNGTLAFTGAGGPESYSFTTPGGAAAPSMLGQYYFGSSTNVQLYGRAPLSGTGALCTGSSCRLDLTGIFGGAGATMFGAYYSLFDGTQAALTGAAVFTLTGNDPSNMIGSPTLTGNGTAGSGTDLTTTSQSGLTNGNKPAVYVGANNAARVVGTPAVVSVQFDANGNPTQIGTLTRSSAKLLQVASGTGWTIGSFGDGAVGANSGAYALGPYQGFGFAVVAPTTALPASGTALYSVASATVPTLADGSLAPAGTFSARLGIAFGSTASTIAYGYDGRLTIPEAGGLTGYSFSTNGGADAPSLTNGTLTGGNFFIDGRAATSTTGANCASVGSCLLYLRGSTGGADATLFGATYELFNSAANKQIANGAAIFTKTSGTGAAATGATGTGSGGAGATTPTYIIGYAANPQGIDTRAGVTATFGANNGLQSYYASYQEFLNAGTNTVTVGYQDSIVSVGRWAGGTTQGTYYANSTGFAYPTNGGFAYAIGSQSPNLPASGTLQYTLLGFAAPTFGDGRTAPGTVTSAAMGVTFGATSKVGLEFSISMPGDGAYSFSTTGGAADPSQSSFSITKPNQYTAATRFNGSGTATGVGGQACPDSAACTVQVQGWFAGDRVERAGLVYTLGGGSTFAANTIHGALAFGSAGLDVPALPAAPQPESTGTIANAFSASSGTPAIAFVKDGVTKLTTATSSVNPQFDSTSKALTSFVASSTTIGRGTAVTGEAWGTFYSQIGRWNGGTITGTSSNTLNAGFQGLHYALWLPSTTTISNSYTGVAQFTLAGATKPTYGDGFTEEGSFAGTMAIGLDNQRRLGLDLTVTMPDHTYTVQTAGGSAQPGKSTVFLSTTGQMSNLSMAIAAGGHACPNTQCAFQAYGGLSGPADHEFVLAYTIGESSSGTFNTYVDGAAAFTSSLGFSRSITLDTHSTAATSFFANGNYSIVSSTGGVSANTALTFGGQHELLTVAALGAGSTSIREVGATAFATGSGNTATTFMGWGRWSDGRASDGTSFTDGRGYHYVYGTPTTAVPTSGTASYTMVGATAPTIADGAHQPGTVTSGAMAIAFGSQTKIGVEMAFTMPGDASYTMSTTGGVASPSTSGVGVISGQARFSGSADVVAVPVGASSVACATGTCSATIQGVLFGAQAAGAGLTYQIGTGNSGITGAAAFTRDP